MAGPDLRAFAERRLAFRELGLAIGLAAVGLMEQEAGRGAGAGARLRLEHLGRYASLRTQIEAFWLRTEHRATRAWSEHEDINDVMLATSLVPEGFLVLA